MTKKLLLLLALTTLLFVTILATVAAQEPEPGLVVREAKETSTTRTAEEYPTCNSYLGENLLTNPSFEEPYSEPPGDNYHPGCGAGPCQTAQTAWGWLPWWRAQREGDASNEMHMPEWKPAGWWYTDPVRVRTGRAAQQYFRPDATFKAGVFQQVTVENGGEYIFSVWGHAWSRVSDVPGSYSTPGLTHLYQMVGIHKGGSTDWTPWIEAKIREDNSSGQMVWGPMREQYDYYGLFEVSATAEADTITVVIWARPEWPVAINEAYWDDACLVQRKMFAPTQRPTFLADVNEPTTQIVRIPVNFSGVQAMGWTATLSGGSLNPDLLVDSGNAGDYVELAVDSSGLPLGKHSTTLTITADAPIPGSPATVPVTVHVVPEIHAAFLPNIRQ